MSIYQAVDIKFLIILPLQDGCHCWDVERHQHRKNGNTSVDARIDLTDCSRKISLEFYFSSPKMFHSRIDKLDTLIDSLLKFRDSMYEARDEKVKAIIKYRKENKGERFKSKEAEEVCKD